MKSMLQFVILFTVVAAITGCSKKQPDEPVAPEAVTEAAPEAAPEPVPAATLEPAPEPAPKAPPEAAAKAEIGDPAAPLDGLTFIKGQPVTLEKGKVYVVEFWATWCPPCRKSIPHLTELQKKLADRGVTIIGVSKEAAETVRPFVEKMGEQMNYTVAIDTSGSTNKAYMEAYDQRGIPAAFIIDDKGTVVWVGHPMADLDQTLELLLAGDFDIEAAKAKAKAEAELAQKTQQLVQLYRDYMTALKNGDSQEKLSTLAEQILETDNHRILNQLSWAILTQMQGEQKDVQTALKFVEKSIELTKYSDAETLHIYALALFENDQITKAVEMQTKAMQLLKDAGTEIPAAMQQQMDQFKSKLDEPAV